VRIRLFAILSALVLCAHPVGAQGLSRYRDYTMGSSVAAVLKATGGGHSDVKTTRERPALMREVSWRAPYVLATARRGSDPVHDMVFSFYNDRLYRVVVTYERDRVEGLTSADVIASISKAYGITAELPITAPDTGTADKTTVARWQDTDTMLTLTRDAYSGQFQIAVVSKVLDATAQAAVAEAARLDAMEAPQRALDLRTQEAAESERTRTINKTGFRP
jgi:hypothetical protein